MMMHAPSLRMVLLALLLVLFLGIGCNRRGVNAKGAIVADISHDDPYLPNAPQLRGHLYLKNGHLRADWGSVVGVFDVKQRNGFLVLPEFKEYMDAGDKDLSTYLPLMINGSICPNAEVPSACKLLGKEKINGRSAKKWDVYTRKGFHVYYWTDETTGLTLRLEIGTTVYEAKNLRNSSVDDKLFEFPSGFKKVDR